MNFSIQRKRRRNLAEIQELVSRYHSSALSQAEFVKREGICLATLHNYLRRSSIVKSDAPDRFVEVERAPGIADGESGNYKITCTNGIALEVPAGFCPHAVAKLLELIISARAQ